MNEVKVNASASYSVKIGSGLLSTLGTEIKSVCTAGTAAILSDSNVWPLYGEAAQKSLENAGLRVFSFVIPAGEQSKNGVTYLQFLNFLAENRLTRSDCVIALGGGVVGDLAGFAAATYLRGIAYIQVPTTLLAAVDSSVGGKTAIDLPAGKNLAGAFCQPRLVLCDVSCLHSLPRQVFIDGCAEVIKYSILFDEVLFAHLTQYGLDFDRQAVITRCVELKRDVVEQDEFDTGLRQKLNLGHTVGHGIEACSHYQITHGSAVAAGIAIVARSAAKEGLFPYPQYEKLLALLHKFKLSDTTVFSAQELYKCMLSDKKRSGDTITLVLPKAIGDCILQKMPIDRLEKFIEAGL